MNIHTYFICSLFNFDWGLIWAFLTAAGTIGLAWVGYYQLKELNKTNQRANEIDEEKFLYQLKSGFFTKEARELLILIENEALEFKVVEDNQAFFKINIDSSTQEYLRDSVNVNRKYYTTEEIDDILLNELEDIGLLMEKKLIDLYDIMQNFEYYLKTIFEYAPLTSYIAWARAQGNDNDIFSKAEWVYHSVEAFDLAHKTK